MNDFSRRRLIKATAIAGAGAVVVPGLQAAEAFGASAVTGASMSEAHGAECPPAKLTGRIVRPDDPGYTDARLGWDQLFSHYPLVIVFAQNTQDVVNALTWARQKDVALRIRGGRHSLEGWSNVDSGLVIDISELKSVRIDSAACVATVGAGLNQLEAVTTLAQQNFAVTTGTEGSVGLAGATLGGGFGFLTRWLGMACDSLIGAEVVVAEGAECAKVINVDLHDNADLLWALRGAGNGNFGIVTSLTYKVAPLKSVSYVQATWDGIGDLRRVFDAWQRTAPYTDDRLGTQLEVHRNQTLLFGVLAEGTPSEAKKLLAPILSVGSPQVSVQVGNWGQVYSGFQTPTEQDPANWKFYSQFTRKPFPSKAIDVISSFMRDAPTDESNFFTQAFGGAVRRSPAAARRSRTATRSSTPSPEPAGGPVPTSRACATRSPRRPRLGSPNSATHCGPMWTAPTSTCRTSACRTGRPPTGGPTSTGCEGSRRSTTRTTSSSTTRASRPRPAGRSEALSGDRVRASRNTARPSGL